MLSIFFIFVFLLLIFIAVLPLNGQSDFRHTKGNITTLRAAQIIRMSEILENTPFNKIADPIIAPPHKTALPTM